MKNVILFLLIILNFSCEIKSEKKKAEMLDTITKSQVIANTIQKTFSYQDSIELWALGDYYFGELCQTNYSELPNLGKVHFNSVSNLRYKYVFSHTFADTNWENPERIIVELYDILVYKYGVPIKLNTIESYNDLLSELFNTKKLIVKRNKYLWKTPYKKIILNTEEVDDKVKCVNLEIINIKLEKEHQIEIEKKKREDIINGANKI